MKTCYKCKLEKSETEFNKNKSRRDGLQAKYKTCDRIRAIHYYHNNDSGQKQKAVARAAQTYKDIQSKIAEIKANAGCCICRMRESSALDFHHLDGDYKEANIAKLVKNGSWKAIEKEISKCIVICSNHHRMYHAGKIKIFENAE